MIHVLYVDDEPELLTLGKIFLERSGDLTVDTAISAHKALEMLGTGSYDAIVSDYLMPGMNGIAFLKRIRADWKGLPFILFTGKGREEVVIEALNNGADFYLQKGSDTKPQFRELHHKIIQAVERRESDEKFRMLVEDSLVGVYVIQGDRFLHVNSRFSEMFGYSPDEVVNDLRVKDLVSSRDRDKVAANLKLRSSGDVKSLHYTFRGRHRDGSDFDVEVAGARTMFRGQPIIIGTILDMRGSPPADSIPLREHRKDMLFNMLVRHDIANRLTVLRGRLKIIRKQCDNHVLFRELEIIDNAGRDIYNLLESARVYQDLGISTPQWQNVEEMIRRVQDHSGTSSLQFSLMVSGLEICANPFCDRVFANLLDNTVRHGVHATEVQVSFRRSEEGVTILWEDNGIGIPADLKEQVFEQGFGSNTGLGLFLCREILSETGISLSETGIPGSGARFEMTVPAPAWRITESPLGIAGDRQTEKSNTPS